MLPTQLGRTEGNFAPDTSYPEKAVRRVLESPERKLRFVLSESTRGFVLGNRSFSAGTGCFCFPTSRLEVATIRCGFGRSEGARGTAHL